VLNHEMDEYLEYTLDETVRVLEDILGSAPAELAHAHHAHDHAHDHGGAKPPAPLVFLEKGPRIVEFQLARLSPGQLLLVERSPEDVKSRPVYEAILVRPGVSRQDREEAAEALTRLAGASLTDVLLTGIGRLDGSDGAENTVIQQLAAILLRQPAADLSAHGAKFREATSSENSAVRAVAHAGLIAIGDADAAWAIASKSTSAKQDFLAAAPLIPSRIARAALRERIVTCLADSQPMAVRRAAVQSLASVPAQQSENFKLIASLAASPQLREAAVATMLQIPKDQRPRDAAAQVVATLVKHAEATPAAKRTTPEFLNAMHLADELLAALPADQARRYRERLREVVVRVVQINTIQEEMRYDTPYFAVEAGRPVQLVLRNPDLMSHNLVITAPGKLREVAQEAAVLSPAVSPDGRQFTPDSANVLFATRMVPSHSQDVLTFTAPREPGEYPYVCTFPNHWMRMYGVMVVVDDLDAWLADPQAPADPLGITRPIVQSWTLEDFSADLAAPLQPRPTDLGARLYKEATCLQCHKLGDERGEEGGAVGPDLSEVFERHKGDQRSVLREILDPSHKIEPKYALYNVLTADGKVLSGIVADQNAKTITLITNPENPQPQVIAREDIDEMAKSSTSMMPKGLMDRFTKEEILEVLYYLQASQTHKHEP
jgi:putative heme-binding domain-containing protein